MGGQGGKKKQSPKATKQVVAVKSATKESSKPVAPKRASSSEGAGKPQMADVVKVGSATEPDTDYSEGEAEATAVKPMQLDAGTSAALKKQLKAAERSLKPTPSDAAVLYLGHIPHGFYEEQMKGFFSQFGTVSRLRLARNKKTGRSRHFAFIEFKHKEVADIVAKSMNGYLMFSKVLVAKVMPAAEVHPELFKNAHRAFRIVDRTAIVRKQFNKAKTAEQAVKREKAVLKGEGRKRRKLEALGIEYEFGGYAAEAAALPAAKRTRGVLTTLPADAETAKLALATPATDAVAEPAAGKAAGKIAGKAAGKAADKRPTAAAPEVTEGVSAKRQKKAAK